MSSVQLNSDALVGSPAAGQIEYNGQFYATDSSSSRAQMQRLVQGTAVATTSGTSITFSSIPAWAKRITVMFSGVSTNGTSPPQIQVGSGSVTTSGYLGANTYIVSGSSGYALFTTGFGIGVATGGWSASVVFHGSISINLLSGNNWVASGVFSRSDTAASYFTAGSITLGGTLDRVVLTTVNGTDTFDAGSVNILYEG